MTEFERLQLQLLTSFVGLQVAQSGDQMRKARALGVTAVENVLAALDREYAKDLSEDSVTG